METTFGDLQKLAQQVTQVSGKQVTVHQVAGEALDTYDIYIEGKPVRENALARDAAEFLNGMLAMARAGKAK